MCSVIKMATKPNVKPTVPVKKPEPVSEPEVEVSADQMEYNDLDLDDFINEEVMKQEEKRDQAMKEKGLLPYLACEKGVTTFTLLRAKPTTRISSFNKEQYVLKVQHKGELKDWTVTINSPFARDVLDKLRDAPIEVSVMRSGVDKATRYEFI
jgi:hypothetical protein